MLFDQYRPSSFTERFLGNTPYTRTTNKTRSYADAGAVRYNYPTSTPIYAEPGRWENYTVTDYENPAWQRGIGVDITGGQEGIDAQRPATVDRTYGRYIPSDWSTSGPIGYEYQPGTSPGGQMEGRTVSTTPESIAAYNRRESSSPFITGTDNVDTYDINLPVSPEMVPWSDDPAQMQAITEENERRRTDYQNQIAQMENARPYNFGTGYVAYQTERALSPSAASSGQYRANMPNQIQASNIGAPEEWRGELAFAAKKSGIAQDSDAANAWAERAYSNVAKSAEIGAAKQTQDMLTKQQQYQAFRARQDKRRGIA